MAKLVSKRYALALFETGLELDKLDEFKKEINFVSEVFEKEPKLLMIFTHPKISKDEKKDLIRKLFEGNVSKEIVNFLYVVVDKRREKYIGEISEYYDYLYNEKNNVVLATVVTAIPMDKNTQDKLKVVLSNKLNKKVELKNIIDNSVIGGAMLKVDNKVIDGTVKGQLQSIEKSLKGMRV